MKSCVGCKYALWVKTTKGRMHPSGDGRCVYPYKIPVLPKSMHWTFREPAPNGGYINRRQDLPDHCVYFIRDES